MKAYIGLGSNLGDRQAHFAMARQALASLPQTALTQFSTVIETAPIGPIRQGPYLNAVAEIVTELAARPLHQELQRIEMRAGRAAPEDRVTWGPRELDLDLLFYGDTILESADLTIPHPRAHERQFVLAPLLEIAPDWIHPRFGQSIHQLHDSLTETASTDPS